jgi:thiamine biosynthesis lipoprotein ApbE
MGSALRERGRPEVGFGDATWPALGTSVRLLTTDPARLGDAVEVVAGQLDALDLAASRFRADSEVSALASGRPTRVSPLLLSVLLAALRAARLTDGAVDPTVGVSLAALGYDRDFAAVPADDPGARLLVRRVPGWRSVRVDPATRTVRVPAGTVLDLGATAKAVAADRAAADAAAAAGCGVLVSLGGDVAVAGAVPPGGWLVQLADDSGSAPHPDRPAVRLRSGGLATSSTVVRRWRRGGARLHHLVDPLTGLPAVGPWRTVTVAAGSCLDADIASTAAVVLGDRGGPWLCATGLPARLVDRSGRVVRLGAWPA